MKIETASFQIVSTLFMPLKWVPKPELKTTLFAKPNWKPSRCQILQTAHP